MEITFPGESAEYRAARKELLKKEIEERRMMAAVAEARQKLPKGGKAPQDYVFDGLGVDGKPAKIKLSELFAPGKDSLVIYNFMFPRGRNDARPGASEGATAKLPRDDQPCPSCVAFIDQLNGAARHFEAAGFNFVVIAKTQLDRLVAFGRERGWKNIRLLSSAENSFKRDYHAETAEGDQVPLMSVFQRDGDAIRHFWSSEMMFAPADPGQDPRHTGTLEPLWTLMDLTPEGRPKKWDEQLSYGEKSGG
jgi:predicted dithiol-disulfide oxidoreductase (DUF899 family)